MFESKKKGLSSFAPKHLIFFIVYLSTKKFKSFAQKTKKHYAQENNIICTLILVMCASMLIDVCPTTKNTYFNVGHELPLRDNKI